MKNEDKILKLFVDSNQKTTEALFGIKEALNKINDQNKLHCNVLNQNTDKLREMVAGNKSLIKIFQWVIISLISALIILAGAEKAIGLIPFIK